MKQPLYKRNKPLAVLVLGFGIFQLYRGLKLTPSVLKELKKLKGE